jgi:hypothetical protein
MTEKAWVKARAGQELARCSFGSPLGLPWVSLGSPYGILFVFRVILSRLRLLYGVSAAPVSCFDSAGLDAIQTKSHLLINRAGVA